MRSLKTIQCWAERLVSGEFQGRGAVKDRPLEYTFTCAQIRDTEDEAKRDAEAEVLRRVLDK